MDSGKEMSLGDLNDLFWRHKDTLGDEEQRLFQAILLELAKGPGMDGAVLEKLVSELGQKAGLAGGP